MTKVLNIDELQIEPTFEVVFGGQTHVMRTPTVQDFIENLKDMQELSKAPSIVEELEMTARMIVRAFPTLTIEIIKSWPVPAIEKLFAIVRGVDPDAEVSEVDASGNDKPAN